MNPLLIDDYLGLVSTPHNQQEDFAAVLTTLLQPLLDNQALLLAMDVLFDVDIANGEQLDFVGQWVGVSRTVELVFVLDYFGFEEDDGTLVFPYMTRFGEEGSLTTGARFIEELEVFAGSALLQDGEYRSVIKAKIAKNQSHGTYSDMLAALQLLFGSDPDLLPAPVLADGGYFAAEPGFTLGYYKVKLVAVDVHRLPLQMSVTSAPVYDFSLVDAGAHTFFLDAPFSGLPAATAYVRVYVAGPYLTQDDALNSKSWVGYYDYPVGSFSPARVTGPGVLTSGSPPDPQVFFVVTDNGNMTINLFVGRKITTAENSMVTNLDALPRPAGVSIASFTHL